MSEETVEVTLKVPKEVVEWFRDVTTKNIEDRLTAELVEVCYAQIENVDHNLIITKYNLGSVFQKYGLLREE